MCTQYYLKNSYFESKRDFSDDYANIDSRKIDMTLSGKYLYKYPNLDLDLDDFNNDAPVLPQENGEEDMYDLQKELEAKFDELFGPIDENN